MSTLERRPALFVDLDGTVRDTTSGRVHPVEPLDQLVKPLVAERLAEFRALGYAIVGVTNQGGVAFGLLTEQDVEAINRHLTERLAPGLFDLVLYCPFHARGKIERYRREADCRKPRPGMAFEARERLGLNLGTSIMVGDMVTDREFASNAGIGTFHWAHEFFAPGGWAPGAAAGDDPSV